jgi:hypothetical protein
VRNLVGVEDRPHRNDHTLGDLGSRDPERVSVDVVKDQTRLAVDAGSAMSDAPLVSLPAPADERLRHALGADERHGNGRRLAAAVAEDGGVRS